jgi:hypothetical protein
MHEHLAVVTHVGNSTIITPIGDWQPPSLPKPPWMPGRPETGLPGVPDTGHPGAPGHPETGLPGHPDQGLPGHPDQGLPVEPPDIDNTLPPAPDTGLPVEPPTISLPIGAFILIWLAGHGLRWARIGPAHPDQGLPVEPAPPTPAPTA